MRLAVCISGYSKESISHVESWLELFNSLNCQVDYYAHFWDNNVDMIVSKLNIPLTRLVVESEQRRRHVSVELPEHDTLYSFMRAANLKKQDEIKNHHFYDVCISLNINVKFNQTSITQFKNLFVKPEHNFVYTFNSENVGYFPFFKLNNDVFFSDSLTFDKLAQFNRFLPVIKNATQVPASWGFYIKMLNIRNRNNILAYEKF